MNGRLNSRYIANKLHAFSKSDVCVEPQIMNLLGHYFNSDSPDANPARLLRLLNSRAFGHPSLVPHFTNIEDINSFNNPDATDFPVKNLATILKRLYREIYLFPVREDVGDVIARGTSRYMFPFCIPVCLRVARKLGRDEFRLPNGLRGKLHNLVSETLSVHSFRDPHILPSYYPISCFRTLALGYSITNNFLNKLTARRPDLPELFPGFVKCADDDLEEYSQKLMRDYRMICGVSFLEFGLSEDPMEIVENIQRAASKMEDLTSDKPRTLECHVRDVDRQISPVLATGMRISTSHLFPLLGAFEIFCSGLFVSDEPSFDFWEKVHVK